MALTGDCSESLPMGGVDERRDSGLWVCSTRAIEGAQWMLSIGDEIFSNRGSDAPCQVVRLGYTDLDSKRM